MESVPNGAGKIEKVDLERDRLCNLLDQAPAGMGLVAGPEHRWSYVNQHYIRMTGRSSAADFLGKTVRESMPELEAQGFVALIEKVYRTGEPRSGHEIGVSVNRGTGGRPEEGYFDFAYEPVRDAAGKIEGVFIYAIEVTAAVAARKVIEEQSELLRLAHSAAQIGAWEWDPIREKNLLSPEAHRILDTSPDDPQFMEKWLSRIEPADRPRVELLLHEGYRLGRMEIEYRYLHPALGPRWLLSTGMRRPAETRMFGIVQDVTLRKSAESDAHRLAAIVESSEDAIVGKNLHGIVTSWNTGAERIFGYKAEEMIGKSIMKIIPPEHYEDESRILATVGRGDRIEHFETVRIKKNGEPLEISLTISPVRDENGKIVGAAKIARDITHQKQAERALRTTERLASVGRLAATVAHEINNPLEAVTNLIFLARNAPQSEDKDKYLAMADEELERVSHLTKQTLGFYRESNGATGVRLGEVVESLLSVFSSRMRNKGIGACSDIREDVEVHAIPSEIRQVVANLLSNSIDATYAGGRIVVRIARSRRWKDGEDGGVRLTIADSGSGISPEIRARLFEPFFTTKKDVGTGLGLWITRNIVENHKGSIRVRSSTKAGRSGTVVSIFLPVAAEDAATSTQHLRRAS